MDIKVSEGEKALAQSALDEYNEDDGVHLFLEGKHPHIRERYGEIVYIRDFRSQPYMRELSDSTLAKLTQGVKFKSVQFSNLQSRLKLALEAIDTSELQTLKLEEAVISDRDLVAFLNRCPVLTTFDATYREASPEWQTRRFMNELRVPSIETLVLELDDAALESVNESSDIQPKDVIGMLERHPVLTEAQVSVLASDPSVFAYRLRRGVTGAIPDSWNEFSQIETQPLADCVREYLVQKRDAYLKIEAFSDDQAITCKIDVPGARREAARILQQTGPSSHRDLVELARPYLASNDPGKSYFYAWERGKSLSVRRFFSFGFMRRVGDAELARMITESRSTWFSLSTYEFTLKEALRALPDNTLYLSVHNVSVDPDGFRNVLRRTNRLEVFEIRTDGMSEFQQMTWMKDTDIDAISIGTLREVNLVFSPNTKVSKQAVARFVLRHEGLTSFYTKSFRDDDMIYSVPKPNERNPSNTIEDLRRICTEMLSAAARVSPSVYDSHAAPAAPPARAKMECRAVITGPTMELALDESGEESKIFIYNLEMSIRDGLGGQRDFRYDALTVREVVRMMQAGRISVDGTELLITRVVFSLAKGAEVSQLTEILAGIGNAGVNTLIVRGHPPRDVKRRPPRNLMKLPPGMRIEDLRLMTGDVEWENGKLTWAQSLLTQSSAYLRQLHVSFGGGVGQMPKASDLFQHAPSLSMVRFYPPTGRKDDHTWNIHDLRGAIGFFAKDGARWCSIADRFGDCEPWCNAVLKQNSSFISHAVIDTKNPLFTLALLPNASKVRIYAVTQRQLSSLQSPVPSHSLRTPPKDVTVVTQGNVNYTIPALIKAVGTACTFRFAGSSPYLNTQPTLTLASAGDEGDDVRSTSTWGTSEEKGSWFRSGTSQKHRSAPATIRVEEADEMPVIPLPVAVNVWERHENEASLVSIITKRLPEDAPGEWSRAKASARRPVVVYISNGELCYAYASRIEDYSRKDPADAPLREPVYGNFFDETSSAKIRETLQSAGTVEVIDLDAEEPQGGANWSILVPTGQEQPFKRLRGD